MRRTFVSIVSSHLRAQTMINLKSILLSSTEPDDVIDFWGTSKPWQEHSFNLEWYSISAIMIQTNRIFATKLSTGRSNEPEVFNCVADWSGHQHSVALLVIRKLIMKEIPGIIMRIIFDNNHNRQLLWARRDFKKNPFATKLKEQWPDMYSKTHLTFHKLLISN